VTVSVNQGFTFLTPFIGAFFSAPFSVGASATAPIMPAVASSGGGGGGATPAPCDLWATFTWSQGYQGAQPKSIIFDATGSTPDPSGSCSPKITKLAWTWDETDTAYATDDPAVPPDHFDVTTTNFSAGLPNAVDSGMGSKNKTAGLTFHVALTVWAGGTTSYTVRQDVSSLWK
jgi:hypothetical protein